MKLNLLAFNFIEFYEMEIKKIVSFFKTFHSFYFKTSNSFLFSIKVAGIMFVIATCLVYTCSPQVTQVMLQYTMYAQVRTLSDFKNGENVFR